VTRPGILSFLPALLGLSLALQAAAETAEWSGNVSLELRGFPSDPVAPDQASSSKSLSLSFQPEYYREWRDGDRDFTFAGFLRYDEQDSERSHGDIRELYWRRVGRRWELSAGIRKLFWGVTESQHLVDIINQTDLVEDPDGEEKLGQPMIDFSVIRRWGTLDFFLLPGFRERTYPGTGGRIRTCPRVDAEEARYESGAGQSHVDWAVRWFHSLGDWDLGLAHFSGTGREPRLLPALTESAEPVLEPFYEQIDQTSLDLQVTKGGWLWKLEAISRRDRRKQFVAATGGFEYTFGNLAGSGIDLGLLAEYLFDQRDEGATSPFENDVFVAVRLALNDVRDTHLLAGAIVDEESGASFVDIQGSSRLGRDLKLTLKARAFAGEPEGDFFYTLSGEDYIQLALTRYF
jgi:hypothetical protein